MSQLQLLLEKLDLSNECLAFFRDVTFIDKPQVTQDESEIRFSLKVGALPPFDLLQEFQEALADYFTAEIVLSLQLLSNEAELIDLQDYLNAYLSTDQRLYRCVFIINYQQGYMLQVYDVELLDYLEEQLPKISKYFQQYGITATFYCEYKEQQEQIPFVYRDSDESLIRVKASPYTLTNYPLVDVASIKQPAKKRAVEGILFGNNIRRKGEREVQEFSLLQDKHLLKVANIITGRNKAIEFKNNTYGRLYGDINFSSFYNAFELALKHWEAIDNPYLQKEQGRGRFELHCHSNMSEMDGVCSVEQLITTAYKMGLSGIAITDHGVIQAFPEAQKVLGAIRKEDPESKFRLVYGCEVYYVNPESNLLALSQDQALDSGDYVVLDLETTGLSILEDEIIEIGAVKYHDGLEVDRFSTLIKPTIPIPAAATKVNNLTDADVQKAPTFQEKAADFVNFIGSAVLVAHNAAFDINFLNEKLTKQGFSPLENSVIDSLVLAKNLLGNRNSYKLANVAKILKVPYNPEKAHRAIYDCEILAKVLQSFIAQLKDLGISTLSSLQQYSCEDYHKRAIKYHLTLLAKNAAGLKDLFSLISAAHTTYLAGQIPLLPKEIIAAKRQNLLVGSSCINNEIWEFARFRSYEQLLETMKFYDYIELQPTAFYYPLIARDNSELQQSRIKATMQRIIQAADQLNIPLVVSGDVHYCFPYQKQFRDIYIGVEGIRGSRHPLYFVEDSENIIPFYHLRTTEMMYNECDYLPEERKQEIIVDNPEKLVADIDCLYPVKDRLYPPSLPNIPDAEVCELLREVCYENAYKQYGDPLPLPVAERLQREISSIITHNFSVIYYTAYLLVKKSLQDGYLVGSRGSIGSSLVATMSKITEVNPLPPHYYCSSCHYSDFENSANVRSGYDLPEKKCPQCADALKHDGQDIPFETFLGFHGDKVPDIDLNFSGNYQAIAHDYTRQLFGTNNVFRAGTIQTVAVRNAFGYVKRFYEEKGLSLPEDRSYLEYLVTNCTGVKRTTGQHPGGIIVIPADMEVHDFTPVQYPANNDDASWYTTHFQFVDIHDVVLKLDILGHVDPTAMHMLKRISGIDPTTLPLNDAKVLSLFSRCTALGISDPAYQENNGALGLPEFGTGFVRRILDVAQPKTFDELVIISGISHGTGNWSNNAEELIAHGTAALVEVIGCRDDIMLSLIKQGLETKTAFDIMESIRKGRGVKEEWIPLLKLHNVPDWYIDSSRKISYLFPKAHAVAYVLMCVRVAWYKIYRPILYYASFFSLRCGAYEIKTMIAGKNVISKRLKEIKTAILDKSASNKDESLENTLEVAYEMVLRGYGFSNISLLLSQAAEFIVDPADATKLLPPFNCIDGLGDAVANSIVSAREQQAFISKEDLMNRTSLNKTLLAYFEELGVLDDMPEENQLSLF